MAAGREIMLLNFFIILALFGHNVLQIVSITVLKDVCLVDNQGLNADGLNSKQYECEYILPCYHVVLRRHRLQRNYNVSLARA